MEIKDLIKNCKSLNEIIYTINREYDLDKKLGITAAAIVKAQIEKVIQICGIKKR